MRWRMQAMGANFVENPAWVLVTAIHFVTLGSIVVIVVYFLWPVVEIGISSLGRVIEEFLFNKTESYSEPVMVPLPQEEEVARLAADAQDHDDRLKKWHLLEQARLEKEAKQKAFIEYQKNRSSADVTKSALDDF